MQFRRRSAGSLAKTAALLFFVGLLFADGVVAFFLIRDRLGSYFPTQPMVFLPVISRDKNASDLSTPAAYPAPTETRPETQTEIKTATPQPATKTYIVKSGDTLFQIAQDQGVSVDDLVNANHLSDRNVIRAGEELIIPSPTTATAAPSPSETAKP
jgi:LysM repeat protein